MKNFLAGLWMLLILFSIGCAGTLFYTGYNMWGVVATAVTVTNLVAFFANKKLPTLNNITD